MFSGTIARTKCSVEAVPGLFAVPDNLPGVHSADKSPSFASIQKIMAFLAPSRSRAFGKMVGDLLNLQFQIGRLAAAAFKPLNSFAYHIKLQPVPAFVFWRERFEMESFPFSFRKRSWQMKPCEIAIQNLPVFIQKLDSQRDVPAVFL
jgi:hypothetical protein